MKYLKTLGWTALVLVLLGLIILSAMAELGFRWGCVG
jgi:hypothetical protein